MKNKLNFIMIFFLFKVYSQQKNCSTVSVPEANISCNFEIWKENSDTVFCNVIGPYWDKSKECDHYYFDLSKNKTWLFFSEDKLILFEKFTIKDSLLNGENVKYYSNGHLKEKSFFINDKLEGKYFKYYRNNQIERYAEYKNGVVNGPFIEYYENGLVRCTSNKCDGHNVGVTYNYWDNLKLASVIFTLDKLRYNEGKFINMYFDPNGNAISEIEFKEMWYCHY
jgi:hypothetical protein